jgi:hypothetical protein
VGGAVVLFPDTLLRIAGMNTSGALPLVQVIGMMVGVYAYGYYLLAREPKRYYGLIWIALAGKTFGPLGFVYSASTGALPGASAGSACSTTSSGGQSSGDSRSSTHVSTRLHAIGDCLASSAAAAGPVP